MKWIEALHLEQWANSLNGRAELAGLVEALIIASAPRIYAYRFPSGDSSQIPGFDGHLEAEAVEPFVPGGKSVWEFGVGSDYLAKANSEYEGRTANPMSLAPAESTFVFVTPRLWKSHSPTLNEWVQQKNAEKRWKRVMAMDAVTLESWLERCEVVAKRYATQIRGTSWSNECLSVDEFWDEYSSNFDPLLTEDVVLCGRAPQIEDLLKSLIDGVPKPIRLKADSPDEVIAFVVACIRTGEAQAKTFLENRTLIIESAQAAREHHGTKGLIYLPRGAAIDMAGRLSYLGPTVIPHAREEEQAISLARASKHAFAQSLVKMVTEEKKAERLAEECGRSVTILARRIARGTKPIPAWLDNQRLIPALLAGGWDADRPADRKILEDLSGSSYDDLERMLRPLLDQPEPLEREGAVWNVRAPVDALSWLGSRITRTDLDRLRTAALKVFGELDPALDLPLSERPYAGMRGKTMEHSNWLRQGMAATFLHIAALHDKVGLVVHGLQPQRFVDAVFEELPGLKENTRPLVSLGGSLSWLAEASPRPLLLALEHLLEGEGTKILPIFDEQEGFFTKSSHTHILWALELLAWDPDYLVRVALALAKLARLDPGGRLENRPINSLRNIFRAWKPETNASLTQRLAALDKIIGKEPEIGWTLTLSLVPVRPDFGMPAPQPRFRDAGASGKELLTRGLEGRAYKEFIDRAIRLASGDIDRLLALIGAMNWFSQQDMERVCHELEQAIPRCDEKERSVLWDQLRKSIVTHTAYSEAEWAWPGDIVNRLRQLKRQLEPADLIQQIKWLFDEHFPELEEARGAERLGAIEENRVEAIRELHRTRGLLGLAELARQVRFPGLVAGSAAPLLACADEFDKLIDIALSLRDVPDCFPMAVSGAAHLRFAEDWQERLAKRVEAGLDSKTIATLLLGWNNEVAAWDQAERFGTDVVRSFWSRRSAFPVRGGLAEKERAARSLVAAGRALSAIDLVSEDADQLPSDLVFQMLHQAEGELGAVPVEVGRNLAYDIRRVFEKLANRPDIDRNQLAVLEYRYLYVFKHENNSLVLHQILAEDPAFFVSILCDIFKPRSGPKREVTEPERRKAEHGYQLLSTFQEVPGFREGSMTLETWVTRARQLAAEKDRATIADQQIGQLLAHVRNDVEDGAWPHRVVRDLLGNLENEEIERGIGIGRSNMVGVHTIDPKQPAALERTLAKQAREWAKLSTQWPRTAAMLETMAQQWEHTADMMEERTRQEAMRE
jgi:hypothetical protein